MRAVLGVALVGLVACVRSSQGPTRMGNRSRRSSGLLRKSSSLLNQGSGVVRRQAVKLAPYHPAFISCSCFSCHEQVYQPGWMNLSF